MRTVRVENIRVHICCNLRILSRVSATSARGVPASVELVEHGYSEGWLKPARPSVLWLRPLVVRTERPVEDLQRHTDRGEICPGGSLRLPGVWLNDREPRCSNDAAEEGTQGTGSMYGDARRWLLRPTSRLVLAFERSGAVVPGGGQDERVGKTLHRRPRSRATRDGPVRPAPWDCGDVNRPGAPSYRCHACKRRGDG